MRMAPTRTRAWGGPPLALQILGLLIGALVVAQLVTLFLTLLLPPAPPARYELDDIARGLRGQVVGAALERSLQAGPPDISGRGWLVSERSRRELAKLIGAREQDVTLAFYTQLPFGGATIPATAAPVPGAPADARPTTAIAHPHPAPVATPRPVLGLVALVPVSPAANGFGQSATGGGSQGGGSQGGGFPGGRFPGGMTGAGFPRENRILGERQRSEPTRTDPLQHIRTPTQTSTPHDQTAPSGPSRTVAGPPYDGPLRGTRGLRGIAPVVPLYAPLNFSIDAIRPQPTPTPAPSAPPITRIVREERPRVAQVAPPVVLPPPPVVAPVAALPREHTVSLAVRSPPPPQAVPLRAPLRGLFGLAAAPFIEGDFVAALREPNGRYALLAPKADSFPNPWQQRVLLWFVLSLALVAPIAWAFARRIVRPLQGFADAAEALGRDPSAAILPLSGPAEVGRAAHAFNLMQNRLRAFVDDRTAMVGAISHDLRTPLTRMRFRIEDVPEDQQDGLLEEVAEMEAMITSVLEFIRDASTPGVRERLDLSELVGMVVRDAKMVGGDVTVESTISAQVDVDAVGMRRLLDNLLENAVKYGVRARVQLSTEGGEAIARIADDGPGIPEDEMERAFEPFYRSASARASEKAGSGLGLAVCRSIARAHGGDVRMLNSAEGFVVQVNVPLAYDGFAVAA